MPDDNDEDHALEQDNDDDDDDDEIGSGGDDNGSSHISSGSSYTSSSGIDDEDNAAMPEAAAAAGRSPPRQPSRQNDPAQKERLLIVVTCASRGLGKAIALSFCQRPAAAAAAAAEKKAAADEAPSADQQQEDEDMKLSVPPTTKQYCHVQTIILVARSGDELQAASTEIRAVSPQTRIVIHAMDLSLLDDLDGLLEMMFIHLHGPVGGRLVDRVVLINNAGTVGPIGSVAPTTPTLASLRQSIDLNITSAIWITIRFIRFMKQQQQQQQSTPATTTIVNISSLTAIEPFPTMATYCAGKAARDMWHACLAKELATASSSSSTDDTTTSKPSNPARIKVLNYAPGPLEGTAMTRQLRRSGDALDPNLHAAYNQQQLVDPADSAQKLVDLVLQDRFTSGVHIDYYDHVVDGAVADSNNNNKDRASGAGPVTSAVAASAATSGGGK